MTPVSKLEQMHNCKVTLPSPFRLGQLLKTYYCKHTCCRDTDPTGMSLPSHQTAQLKCLQCLGRSQHPTVTPQYPHICGILISVGIESHGQTFALPDHVAKPWFLSSGGSLLVSLKSWGLSCIISIHMDVSRFNYLVLKSGEVSL